MLLFVKIVVAGLKSVHHLYNEAVYRLSYVNVLGCTYFFLTNFIVLVQGVLDIIVVDSVCGL